MRQLDAAGIPFFLKSTDHYGHLFEGAAVARASGVAHTLVFRFTPVEGGFNFDVPDYSKSPRQAAETHWQKILERLPPEFDRELVWIEPINEVDKNRADWLGNFAAEIAVLAAPYKLSLFAWSAGEPEPAHWQAPGMRRYLEMCAAQPHRLAVSLHEYSYTLDNIRDDFPNKIGRFQQLFAACDAMNLTRPVVHITEWGWTYQEVPGPEQAIADIDDIAELYAQYPQIKGAATWYLGQGFGGIANLTQKIIAPLTEFTLTRRYQVSEPPVDPLPPGDCRGTPRVPYRRTYVLLPPSAGRSWAQAVVDSTWESKRYTLGGSADDAGIGDLDERHILAVNPAEWGPGEDGSGLAGFYAKYYPGVELEPIVAETPAELATILAGSNPIDDIDLTVPLSGPYGITSDLDDPRDYDGDGQYDDLHEGVDFAPTAPGSRVLAAAPGVVHDVRNYGGYGLHVILKHDDGRFFTWYAHMLSASVVKNQVVGRSQPLGLVGSSGNSSGPHVHFTLQVPGHGLPGYVVPDVVNPLGHMTLTPIVYGDFPVGVGLHASADPAISAEEVAMTATVRPDILKVMSLHDPDAIRQLATQHPSASWVVRAYLSFKDRPAVTPEQFYNDTIADVRRTLEAIGAGRDVVVELHNEPNLVDEGLGVSWANGAGFKNWYGQLLTRYRQGLPGARFIFPGLSPGGDVPGVRQGHESFINQCRDAVLASDGLGVHLYWAHNYPMALALEVLDGYRGRFPAQAIWVTEASNNKINTPAEQKAQQYLLFWQALRQRPLVRGVTFFVASASNPAWGWGTGGSGEVWLGTAIPAIVGGR